VGNEADGTYSRSGAKVHWLRILCGGLPGGCYHYY